MIDIQYTMKHFDELSLTELYEIMRLRQEIFVVEQNCPYVDADRVDLKAHHYMGKDKEGILHTYTRLIAPGDVYDGYSSIGRVVNSAAIRGHGAGKTLMSNSIQIIKTLYPDHPIKIGAQCYLQRFYESIGFVDIDQRYIEDGIPHMKMVFQ
jgi:ElaA protein